MTDQAKPTLLITGNAGFIGMHTALRAAAEGYRVIGLDNLNSYYDVQLKVDRLAQQGIRVGETTPGRLRWGDSGIGFVQGDLTDRSLLQRLFSDNGITHVIHLAAQAGVRYSIDCPEVYIESNITGYFNVLEACRSHGVQHLVYASSSSIYGLNREVPFSEGHKTDSPISLYAASKKSNELMAHTYAHLFGIRATGLRFFTVYGPWGRPDMALFKFTRAILEGKPIDVYNEGRMSRDFTYVDDIVDGIMAVLALPPDGAPPCRVLNIGRNEPVSLDSFIQAIEQATGRTAQRNLLPLQPGDVERTFADTSALTALTGLRPKVDVQTGVQRFVEWYRGYYGQ